MYFPYLRGRRHEVAALHALPQTTFQKVLPILEPVARSSTRSILDLSVKRIGFILITNPENGQMASDGFSTSVINTHVSSNSNTVLGYIINHSLNISDLNAFLHFMPGVSKAIIFRYNPAPASITQINNLLQASADVDYLVFDDRKTTASTRNMFAWHNRQVIIEDGFQKFSPNSSYPVRTHFSSRFSTYQAQGLFGFGDYQVIGDFFSSQEGGSIYVVALHYTRLSGTDLEIGHHKSVSFPTINGQPQIKFSEAVNALVSHLPLTRVPSSTGTAIFQDWDTRGHYPNLGLPKQASIQHHIQTIEHLI